MPFQTIPVFTISSPEHDINVEIHPVDLKNITECMIVSPQFLQAIAGNSKPLIRTVAAGHLSTPVETLVNLLQDESPIVYFAALENPQTPFDAVLYRWHKFLPEGTVWDSPAIVDRHEDLEALLAACNISVEDSKHLPARWIIKVIKDA